MCFIPINLAKCVAPNIIDGTGTTLDGNSRHNKIFCMKSCSCPDID